MIRYISKSLFAICINNDNYPVSLERSKVYQIIPDEKAAKEGYLRVVDESGEDYLYPESYFITVKLPLKVQDALLLAS